MRIATSTIYSQQITTIDNQAALFAQVGEQLSSGISLTAPSDDPARIAQDLALGTTLGTTTQQATNVQSAVSELTTTDGALSSLTSVLQSANTLATQGASDTLTASQRSSLASQIDQLLQQSITIGNTSFGGKYVFAGSATPAVPPVQHSGNPISSVTFNGNEQAQGQLVVNNESFALSTTFQAAFNFQAADGSSSVFDTLIRLRDTLQNNQVADVSAGPINAPGAIVFGAGSPVPTALNAPNTFATTPVPDNGAPGAFTIEINSTVNGQQVITPFSFNANAPIDDGTPNSIVGAIQAQSAVTGVTASYNATTQRITLSSTGAGSGTFFVTDQPTPAGTTLIGPPPAVVTGAAAATKAGNLTAVLGLSSQADMVQNVSIQLGDISHVLNTVLEARAVIGARIQTLGSIQSQLQTSVTDTTKVQSGIEGTDVASATAKFSATQTALQAAYATTTRLESKTLFDYL